MTKTACNFIYHTALLALGTGSMITNAVLMAAAVMLFPIENVLYTLVFSIGVLQNGD